MLHQPESDRLFPTLTADDIEAMRPLGTEATLGDGDVLFKEGDPHYDFYIVIEGQLRVTRRLNNEERVLGLHQPGGFTGDITMLSGDPAPATVRAVGAGRVLRIGEDAFRELMGAGTPLAQTVMAAMSARTQDVEAQVRQQEKLAALGKMSAGLAHELNNPASAAQRGASLLMGQVKAFGYGSLDNDRRFTAPQREQIIALFQEVAKGRKEVCLLSPLDRSDREGTVADWLVAHGMSDPWKLTGNFIEGGLTVARLDTFAAGWLGDGMVDGLAWIESMFSIVELVQDIEQSTRRISEVVGAMKDYSHMDQSSVQVVDINRSLDTTLTIFAHRLKYGITVERQYDLELPSICAYAGELNQVWTNIIDNAIDAMKGKGTLRIRTSREDEAVLVEIGDSGPGVPLEIQGRIFDPFFTTKPIGKGTGLGLDISYRIITQRHRGNVKVVSTPGDTRFQIRLPVGHVRQNPDEQNPGGLCEV